MNTEVVRGWAVLQLLGAMIFGLGMGSFWTMVFGLWTDSLWSLEPISLLVAGVGLGIVIFSGRKLYGHLWE